MKRAIALTLVLFILSMGGLAAVTLWMCKAQDRVEFVNVVERGDPAVAAGLQMTENDLLDSRVLWTTEHNLGNGTQKTETTMAIKDSYAAYGTEFSRQALCMVAPAGTDVETYIRQQIAQAADNDVLIHTKDFAEYYNLCLQTYGGGKTIITEYEGKAADYVEFPYLRIPAEEEDCLILYGDIRGNTLHYYCNYAEVTNAARFHDVTIAGGTVVTAGFAPKVQPKQDWAPEGFGLWLVHDATKEEPQGRIELVYPLDIEKQRVVKLTASPKGDKILLFLVEEGELKLQVLRSDTFSQEQTLSLGGIGVQENEYSYYYKDGVELKQEIAEYDSVRVCKGENFYAVAAGKQLTALENGTDGLKKLFSCYMPDLYVIPTVDGLEYGWEDEGAEADSYVNICNPSAEDRLIDFENMSMALRDGKLALAWADQVISDVDVAVQIYSAEGLIYARFIGCELYRKTTGTQYIYSSKRPELVWQE